MKKVIKEGEISIQIVESLKTHSLNFTDVIDNSNKMYLLELVKCSKGNHYLYTNYGRVGGTIIKEYRPFDSLAEAEKESEKILKSKLKKGYVKVDLIQQAVGSEVGKSKVSITDSEAKKLNIKIEEEAPSTLHVKVQEVVKKWFGSLEQFVTDNLDTSKCALGQLSIAQIEKGRNLLLEARKIVTAGGKDKSGLDDITNKYYSSIPTNFGYKRLDINVLRFDSHDKLDRAFDILETLENAKGAERVISKRTAIDQQYKSLNTELDWVDPQDPYYKWVELFFHKTKASNHRSLHVKNVFKLKRNSEYEEYMAMVEKMAKSGQKRVELPQTVAPIWDKRIKEHKEYEDLCEQANILQLCHGTRTENMSKILSSKILMRKPGFTVSGAMYDSEGGCYFGWPSKACSYSSAAGSYWSGGKDQTGFVFISDVALGKQTIARGPHPYTLKSINPNMSVWAKGGISGVINDEFIVYTISQNWLRYVVEFTTR